MSVTLRYHMELHEPLVLNVLLGSSTCLSPSLTAPQPPWASICFPCLSGLPGRGLCTSCLFVWNFLSSDLPGSPPLLLRLSSLSLYHPRLSSLRGNQQAPLST